MFMLDVESMDIRSSGIVLSLGLIHFNGDKSETPQSLLDKALFVKFSAVQQVNKGRTIGESVFRWWNKQGHFQFSASVKVMNSDLTVEEGFQKIYDYINKYKTSDKDTVWIRGSLDQLIMEDLANQFDLKPIFYFNVYRDVRTAIDLTKETTDGNGYCPVPVELMREDFIAKHHPVYDCIYDIMMLVHGK